MVSERIQSRTVTDGTRTGTQSRTLIHVVTKCPGSPARSHWIAGAWSFAQFGAS